MFFNVIPIKKSFEMFNMRLKKMEINNRNKSGDVFFEIRSLLDGGFLGVSILTVTLLNRHFLYHGIY